VEKTVIIAGERRLAGVDLAARSARAAGGFHRLGIRENDRVALMLRNDFAFFEASFAALDIGAYPVPINWHFKAEETRYILRDSGAKALVCHADLLPQIAAGLPGDLPVLVVPTPAEIAAACGVAPGLGTIPPSAQAWDDWIAAQAPRSGPPAAPRASMIYTSGTTGRPKGVRREPWSGPTLAARTRLLAEVFGFAPGAEIRTVMTGPLYHASPNSYGLTVARAGGTVVLQPRFDAAELLALIERHRITHLHMVPTMFVRLLRLPEAVRRRHDLSSLRFVVHGAAPCPPAVKRAMIEWWGPVVHEYYGSTETSIVAFLTAEEALRKPGAVGRPISGSVIRIYGDDGRPLPPGKVGEIYARVMDLGDFTYHGKDAMRAEVERDALITVGDVGYVDDDGYVYICDRKRDMVISGGVNIYPAEIEAALIGMPGVHDCAVFGIPHEEFGEALCACVEPLPGAELDGKAVKSYLAARLAAYKVPAAVEFLSPLPREDSGKIFKRKLRDPYWQAAGRTI
jgi:long-chain acyl-CoA synthetase